MKLFQNPTSAELEAAANSILKQDREKGGSSADEFELLKYMDRNRKEKRRYNIARDNEELINEQTSPEYRMSPEQQLIRKERASSAKNALLRTLLNFEDDYLVKQIIVAVLVYDVDFRSTRAVAETCGISVKEAHTAKERLKYFVLTDTEILKVNIISN